MAKHLESSRWRAAAFIFCLCPVLAWLEPRAQQVILKLKNGDRISGRILSETGGQIVLTNSLYGQLTIPAAEIQEREVIPPPEPEPEPAPPPPAKAPQAPAKKKKEAAPIEPANPEAAPIKSTPSFWKHNVQFGLNLRYSTRDQQEYLVISRSTYARNRWRHILEYNFAYGETEGEPSANRMSGSKKTEYQFSERSYVLNVLGAGYDKLREIDLQYEVGPGYGVELLRSTNYWNLVWKNEIGFNFQRQHRSQGENQTTYSARIAEIFAWRVWEKLTADAKIEFFPNLDDFGEYRFRIESNLRYPVTDRLSVNVVLVDLYDTRPAPGVEHNDLQIRSTLGVKF